MRIFSRILLVTVNCSKVDGKMLNTPIRYSFFEFSIKIFTFWEDLRGYYLSKSEYLIIEAITISSDRSSYNNVIIICKLFENVWKILDIPTRYPFFFLEFSIFIIQKHFQGYWKLGYSRRVLLLIIVCNIRWW